MEPDKHNELPLLRILFVEDDEHDRAAFFRAFKKGQISYDYEITDFVRAEDAMARLSFEASQFDILVTDYMLPGMTGLEFCEELIKSGITIPMVILTGSGSEQAAVQAIRAGIDDYIVKDPDQGYLHLLPVVLPEVVKKYNHRIAHIQAEERLYSFMDSATDGLSLLDNDLNFQYMNPAGLKMLGVKPENIVGKNALDVNPLLKESGRYEAYMGVIETGRPYFAEDVTPHEKFGDIHLSVRAFKVSGGLGIMAVDITDRKRNEQQRELQLRILDIINRYPIWKEKIENILNEIKEFTGLEAVAIRLREGEDFPYYATKGFPAQFVEAEKYLCTRDHKGEIIRDSEGNPYVECMCGNVICGRTDASLAFFTEGGSFWSNNTSKLLAETTDDDRQARTRNRCNSEGYESVALFPLKAGHEILGLLQVNDTRLHQFSDDTIQFFEEIGDTIGTAFSQNLAEDALRREKRVSEDYINSLPGLFYVFDEKRFVRWNNEWNKITGYSDEELAGMYGPDFFEGKDRTLIREQMQNTFREGASEAEVKLVTKDGRRLPYYFSGLRKTLNGKEHLIGLGIDITERKQLEEQLRQTHKMEAVGTLTGGIAHDFNNLLFMIVGNAELALEDIPEWNPTYASLEAIKTAGLKASGIVKQLLNFSRKTDQKLIPVDAVTVIKDALKFLRSAVPTTVEFRKHLPDNDITIMADSVQINQLLMNLCTNASQAMEKTGGILEITVENECLTEDTAVNYPDLTTGEHVKITVSDTGPGIDPEIIDRIFDPYFTTKEVGKGSGMGLSVVHGIVNSHNGAITVDSELGKGATYTILFPVISDEPVMEAKPLSDKTPRGNETILLVDDEESITTMIGKMLERLGYQVETRLNPLETLELFKSKPHEFDLVITDMTMPQMTGAKLSEKLKEVRSDIPVIICTGHSSLIDEDKAKKLGIDAYVMKPIVKNDIAKTIRKVLGNTESFGQQ